MLIATNDQLKKYIPNVIAHVDGELSLYDKIEFHIVTSERWLVERFITSAVLAKVDTASELYDIASQVVALDAFRKAIPSLDLVLTPNGFGIVSNDNIAPASKDRIQALLAQMLINRDEMISQMLPHLAAIDEWRNTSIGYYFAQTLFPTFDIVKLMEYKDDIWRHYQILHRQLDSIEYELATQYISEALYTRLRNKTLVNALSPAEREVVEQLRNIEIDLLKGRRLSYDKISAVVDILRKDEAAWPEWHQSAVKLLFDQQGFQNDKKSNGFFFA